MGVYIWKERLPSAYQEVEWVGSSRTQVINTGVIPATQTYTAELEVESTQNGGEYWAFGIWGTTGFRGGQDSSGHWDTSFGASYEPSSYSLNTKTKITLSNAGKGTSSNTAIGLFGMGENGAYPNNRKGAYKIYYCKIWDSDNLIREFIPCYRKSDNVIGMYDLVNNQFYTNSGSGTFTKGQDINYVEHELKNAYIGEYQEGWQPGENTLFYAPLTGDVSTQGSYTVTLNTNIGSSFSTTSAGKTYLQQTNGRILFAGSTVFPQTRTVNYWFYPVDTASKTYGVCIGGNLIGTHSHSLYSGVRSGKTLHDVRGSNGTEYAIFGNDTSVMNKWNMLTITWEPSQMIGYLNGVQIGTKSTSNSLRDSDYIAIGSNDAYCNQKISEIIIEGVVRTAQEIANYYNSTKGDYGL